MPLIPNSASSRASLLGATLLTLGALAPAAVTAQSATTPDWVNSVAPGTWAAISLNTLKDVDPAKDPAINPNYPNSAPWRANSGQGAVIGAWNGGAYASNYGTHGALLVFGGGHAGYYGSEVYAFDLGTRRWKRVTDPYPGPIKFPYPSTSYPDGSPVPPHTYDYVDYHPGTNSFMLFRALSDGYKGTNETSIALTHMLDLDTKQWRKSRQNGNLRLHSGGISCYDRNRDVFWIMGPSSTTNAFSKFDPKVANSDGTYGAYTNYEASTINIDSAADCDPVNDLFVYTMFRHTDRVYARDLSNPNSARVILNQTGDIPEKTGANGWAWSDTRQAFLYWRRGAGVYEFKHVDGDWASGTWRWKNLTASSNTATPPNMNTDNGVYSRFRVARLGNEEVALIVNGVDKPVYAFRIPKDGSGSSSNVTVQLTANPRTIAPGGTSQLNWTTSNAASCTASGGWTGSRPTSGSANVGPLSSSTLYTLECKSSSGGTGRASVEVAVSVSPSTGGDGGSGGGSTSNNPPTVSGTPLTSVKVGSAYTFTPKASDADGDSLTYTVQGKPAWASFDKTTGTLSGTPTEADVGVYSGIIITVSDGKDSLSLPAFSISVVSEGTYGGTLSWIPPVMDANGDPLTDLAGYFIYYGTAPGTYTKTIKVNNPGLTSYTVDGLTAGTYYFVVTGYDTANNESEQSAWLKVTLGAPGDGETGKPTTGGSSVGDGTNTGSAGTDGGTATPDASSGGGGGGGGSVRTADLAFLSLLGALWRGGAGKATRTDSRKSTGNNRRNGREQH